ncbi:MAG TPA: M20/M25/M40 family metallo-hydrolase, partial [Chitinophagaceae bacterium]|nr:M20/M25/M40 family metallo-hydrolase [Chitinophagaceae bacterium]
MRKLFALILSISFFVLANAQDKPDPTATNKIKEEEVKNSKVMDIAFHLTDVSGPRLTSSPGFFRAANWAKDELIKMGLTNVHLEPWGEFGKSWQQEKCYVAMTAPYYAPLLAMPKAWTGSTPGKGSIKGGIILIKAKDSVELQQYAGKLKGKIIMIWSTTELKPSFTPDGSRQADTSLEKMAKSEGTAPRGGNRPRNNQMDSAQRAAFASRGAFTRRLATFVAAEKPALILSIGNNGSDGTLFVQGGGSAKDSVLAPANVVLSSDDFLRLQRLLNAGVNVEMEAEVKTKFFDSDLQGYNVVAEIPGTDPKLKDEVVMLGGHLDSWQGATGATDNAAGCSVMMEAVRLIKSLGMNPRRTIRIALWSGEEQGLFGSRNYVKNHFADPAKMELKPEHGVV